MRKLVALIIAASLLSSVCHAQLKSATEEEPVFRAPFTLKLGVDNERYYEERFDRVPYVAENDVYLFVGESFGLRLRIVGDEIFRVTYEGDLAKADVELKFTQKKSSSGLIMLLVVRNKLKRKLYLDALMTVPGKKGVLKTNVLPVEPKLSNFESWPHPIVQLVLRDLRFSEKPKQSTGEKPEEGSETVEPENPLNLRFEGGTTATGHSVIWRKIASQMDLIRPFPNRSQR